jgi:hypothetical protein
MDPKVDFNLKKYFEFIYGSPFFEVKQPYEEIEKFQE